MYWLFWLEHCPLKSDGTQLGTQVAELASFDAEMWQMKVNIVGKKLF